MARAPTEWHIITRFWIRALGCRCASSLGDMIDAAADSSRMPPTIYIRRKGYFVGMWTREDEGRPLPRFSSFSLSHIRVNSVWRGRPFSGCRRLRLFPSSRGFSRDYRSNGRRAEARQYDSASTKRVDISIIFKCIKARDRSFGRRRMKEIETVPGCRKKQKIERDPSIPKKKETKIEGSEG